MMLFKILKLFGLDIPAKMEAAQAGLEVRLERAKDQVKPALREAAVIGALTAFAALTAAMALGIGLIALYRWAAQAYGPNIGLGAVGTVLVMATVFLAMAAMWRGKLLTSTAIRSADTTGTASGLGVASVPGGDTRAASRRRAATTASDLVEPLSFFLSRALRYRSFGNPVVDELIGKLRTTAGGTTEDAIDQAANVIRYGDRTSLIVVLAGAAFVGWLITHHSR
jgi:hypothetical protein